jgi:hypothetical protein
MLIVKSLYQSMDGKAPAEMSHVGNMHDNRVLQFAYNFLVRY